MTRQSLYLPNGQPFRYIQRIVEKHHPDESRKGVDRIFGMDYMGSAEFEFGALPQSLKRFRAVTPMYSPKHVKFRYQGPGFPAFYPKGETKQEPLVETGKEFSFTYLGPEEFLPTVKELFESQVVSAYDIQLKELTRIDRAYGLDRYGRSTMNKKRDVYGDVIGWWDIEHDWVAFKRAKHAHLWLEAVTNKEEGRDERKSAE